MLRRRRIDDQPPAKENRMPPRVIDDLQHAGAAAEVDDLDDVGEGEVLEAAQKAHRGLACGPRTQNAER
jgi:hypothetical protein